MRTIVSPTAGSIGSGLYKTIWLDEESMGIPPRVSAATFTVIVNVWHNLKIDSESKKTVEDHRRCALGPTQVDPAGLIFTHTDLAPRNIMFEEATGKIWVIDWDLAGFYPRYFEAAGMLNSP